jgi:benzodiazapine receptor
MSPTLTDDSTATGEASYPGVLARDVALGAAPLVAGSLVGLATNARGMRWYRGLAKPSWTPPDSIFGPVWTVLYLMMGTASVIVARERRERSAVDDAVGKPSPDPALLVYAVQLALNLGWSIVFFGVRRTRLAGAEIAVLWVSIVATIVAFARVRLVAGMLLLPYLAWTTFAALLNADLIRRNPDA